MRVTSACSRLMLESSRCVSLFSATPSLVVGTSGCVVILCPVFNYHITSEQYGSMNRKVTLRCTLISLLLALPAPLLIVMFLSFTEGALTRQLLNLLEVEGLTTSYLSVVVAGILLLLAATFTLQAFSHRFAVLAVGEN